MAKSTYQTIKIFDISVFSSSYSQLLFFLESHLLEKKSLLTVMTPNPEQVVLSRKNRSFLDQLRSADILIPDGIGLILASHMLSTRKGDAALNERISGKDVALGLLARVVQNRWSALVVGGREYIDSSVSTEGQLLTVSNINLFDSVYWTQGYADISHPTAGEEAALLAILKQKKPDIVFIAFGAPYQENWLVKHRLELEFAGVKLAMVVGGAFDVLLGKIAPAPKFMQKLGLEWLFRLFQEPWRWRRQLQLLTFIKLVVQQWLFAKS